jgi:hypothetical protein
LDRVGRLVAGQDALAIESLPLTSRRRAWRLMRRSR